MARKKLSLKFAVTARNIQMRFEAQKAINPDFTLEKMAESFGAVDKQGKPLRAVAWRWLQRAKYPRLPSKTYKCPQCHQTQFDRVKKWINDSSIGQ